MAAILSVGRMRELVDQVARQNGAFFWLENDKLVAGSVPGAATWRIDFVAERIESIGARRVEPSSPGTAVSGLTAGQSRGVAAILAGEALAAEAPMRKGRRTGFYHVEVGGRRFGCASARDLLVFALRLFERVAPGTLDRLSAEKARTKRVVSRDPQALYARGRPGHFAQAIEDGWWVAVNNSFPEVERYIRRAAFHAGLEVEVGRSG